MSLLPAPECYSPETGSFGGVTVTMHECDNPPIFNDKSAELVSH